MIAIAMTEPGTGSDLAGIRTTATLSEDGTHYVLNGAKTFITGGVQADLVSSSARTSPADAERPPRGLSILCVDAKHEGYAVGRKLDKIGLRASDTAELSFTDVKVPVENLLGEEGKGFSYLASNLARERLGIAYGGSRRPRPRSSSPRTTPGNARSSASRWPRSRTPSSCSPVPGRGRRRRRRGRPGPRALDAGELTAADAAWRSCSAPRSPRGSSTSACSCTAATAT